MISSAVIVAVSDGERHRSSDRGSNVPSPAIGQPLPVGLIPVLDRPIVARAVADLADAGVEHIAVLVDDSTEGRVAAALAADGERGATVDLVRRENGSPLSEAIDSARLVIGGGPFALHFGGCVGRDGLRDQLERVTLRQLDALALMSRFDDADTPTPTAVPASARRAIGEFHVGVFALGSAFPSALPILEEDASSWMEAALAWMERQGGMVDRRFVTGWWRQRDSRQGTLAANRFVLAGLEPGIGPVEGIDAVESDVQGPVAIDPTARIESSVVRGPVHIGPGARISDAFIGPFTSIGPGVVVDGAEIESSVVLEGSRITSIDGRLDSSVIGPHATVGKDFRIPRGTRLEVGAGAHVMFQ